MQREVHTYSRLEAAGRNIDLALQLFQAGSPWPPVLILARSAGQYLSDRLRREGRVPFIGLLLTDVQSELSPDVTMDAWKRRSIGKADLFRHDNEDGVADEATVSSDDVHNLLLSAIADYIEVAGKPTDGMLAWGDIYFNSEQVVALKKRMSDPKHAEVAKAHTRQALLALSRAKKTRRGPGE